MPAFTRRRHLASRRGLTTAQQLELSPLEKWRRFGYFPWKLTIHICLVALVTAQAVLINTTYAGYSRAVGKSWIALFFPEDLDPVDDLHAYEYNLFETNATLEDAQALVATYYDLPSLTMEDVEIVSQAADELDPPTVEVRYTGGSLTRYTISSASDTAWPLSSAVSPPEAKALISRTKYLEFHFYIKAFGRFNSHEACYVWDLAFKYDFSSRGLIQVDCSYAPMHRCQRRAWTDDFVQWIGLCIGVLAVAYQVLLLKATRKHYQTMKKLINAATDRLSMAAHEEFRWANMTWAERIQVFNLWFIVSTLGNGCAVTYSIWCLADNSAIVVRLETKFLMGLACAMYWVALVQYLEFTLRYYVLILTLKRGIPRMFQFLLGIMPIFIGYVMFGMVVFGDQSSHFGSISATAITLFAVVNGDVVRDTYEELDFLPFASETYLYSYIFLFMYVVLMSCIAIMEEAFFSSASHVLGPTPDAALANQPHHGANNTGDDEDMAVARRTLPPRLRALVRSLSEREAREHEAEEAEAEEAKESWFDQARRSLRARVAQLGQRSPAPVSDRLRARVEQDMRVLLEQLHEHLDVAVAHTCTLPGGGGDAACARCQTQAMHAAAVTATMSEICTAVSEHAGGQGQRRNIFRSAGPPELSLDDPPPGSPRSPRSPRVAFMSAPIIEGSGSSSGSAGEEATAST